MRQLFQELKRRNVYKVTVAYVTVAFVGFQAAKLLIPSTVLPPWTDEFFLFLLIVGFPVALVVAWAFEMTPEGVRRMAEAEEGAADPFPGGAGWVTALVVLLVAGGGLWYLTAGGGEEPAPETGAAGDTGRAESTVSDRSIAVLPFDNLSGTEEAEPFVNGIHDDLLTRLSNISELKVISRTSVLPYRETELSLPAIAGSLGVAWIVEGGVQQAGDRVQVNAQLIQAEEDAHRWAETYRRKLTTENLFAVQSELTKKIARSLEAELSPEEAERVERRPTGDLDAYKFYVQGRSQLDIRTEEGMRQAVDYFQRAIARDSSYALAWSGLADAIGLLHNWGYVSPDESLPDHERTARRALELGPELAEAHASMGLVHLRNVGKGNAPSALQELQRAVELKPSYAEAHHWLGLLLFDIGRREAGHEHLSLAVELTPRNMSARATLVETLLVQGDLEAAERHVQRLRGPTRATNGFFLYSARRWDELKALAREQLAEEGDPAPWHFFLARIAALRGDTATAREHVAELREAEAYWEQGLAHAALGESDAAFSAWGKKQNWSFEQSRNLRHLFSDVLDPLRADPRYRALIREINEQWGLNPDGSIPDSVDVSFEPQSDD